MSRLLREHAIDDSEEDSSDGRVKTYDDAPPRRFKFMMHHLRRRRIFLGIVVILVIIIIIVASVSTTKTGREYIYDRYAYNDFRLPDWISPVNYVLNINTDFTKSTFNGTVNITINFDKSAAQAKHDNYIVIHSLGLELDYAKVLLQTGPNKKPTPMAKPKLDYTLNDDREYVQFYFDELQKLKGGNNGTFQIYLFIPFNGTLSSKTLAGYYLSLYANKTQSLATTQFEATDARRAFPCFDQPDKKATFDITMTVNKGYNVISNMPQKSTTTADTVTTVVFDQTPKMSTYLVCFIAFNSANFAFITRKWEPANKTPVDVRVFTTADTINQAEYALNSTIEALGELVNFFEIDYPLPKLDVVAIPDFAAGAMENWGIVTFRVTALLFDPNTGSAADKQRVKDVIVHELAHQWFGNLVTMKWWSDIFLNEGFATFMEYNIINQTDPSWEIWGQFQIDVHQSAFALDSLNTHAIRNNATSPAEIADKFDSITYDKGASVIKMLNTIVDSTYGPGTFQTTIKAYLQKYKFSNAAAADLWGCFPSDKINVSTLMNDWINKPGFPYLTVTAPNATLVNLAQTRFLFNSIANTTRDNTETTWTVYASGVDSKGVIHNFILTEKTQTFGYDWATNGYLLLNYDGSGYYRTLYNVAEYTNLISSPGSFSPVQRSILYDDAFNLLRIGQINSSKVLTLVNNLASENETDYVVWYTALSGLNNLNYKLPCKRLYQEYVQKLLSPAVNTVGWTPKSSDDHLSALLRSMILTNAVTYNLDSVSSKAMSIWADYAKNNTNTIDGNVRNAVLRSVIANGGQAEFDSVISLYNNVNSTDAVKVSCLQAMAYATDPLLIDQALNFALTKARKQDAYIVFVYMARNPIAMPWAWMFFKDNIAVFNNEKEGLNSFMDSIVLSFANSFVVPSFKINEVEQFLGTTKLTSATKDLALEIMTNNNLWLQNYGNDFCSALTSMNTASTR